jgi:hypothetical protein
MSYNLTKEKLSKANKVLLKDLHSTLGIDRSVLSNNQLLQKISQALFSKSFEEVEKTIFSEKKDFLENGVSRVFLIHYGSETLLVVDGELEIATFSGNSGENTFNMILREAEKITKKLNASPFKKIILPRILGNNWSYVDVIKLADKMGYFKYSKTLFEVIDSNKMKVLDGSYLSFGLKSDWKLKMVSEYDTHSEIEDYNIWYIEVEDDDIDANEHATYYEFTFDDICNAILSDSTWFITESNRMDSEFVISFN